MKNKKLLVSIAPFIMGALMLFQGIQLVTMGNLNILTGVFMIVFGTTYLVFGIINLFTKALNKASRIIMLILLPILNIVVYIVAFCTIADLLNVIAWIIIIGSMAAFVFFILLEFLAELLNVKELVAIRNVFLFVSIAFMVLGFVFDITGATVALGNISVYDLIITVGYILLALGTLEGFIASGKEKLEKAAE